MVIVYTEIMARPRKIDEERFIARQIRFQPGLWRELERRVSARERSAFIRQALRAALLRRAAEALRDYYGADAEAREWAAFAGDTPDE